MAFLDKLGITDLATRLRKYFATKGELASAVPTKTSELSNDSGYITFQQAPVQSVNGQTGAVTVEGGLEPLIGSGYDITPAQVKAAVLEGRSVCIEYTDVLDDVQLDLQFTNFNYVEDTTYQGQAINGVVAQTIAYHNNFGGFLVWTMIGDLLSDRWGTFHSTLAVQFSDISMFYNDVGYITSSALPTTTSALTNDSGFITSSQAPVQSVNGSTGAVSLGASDVGALANTGGNVTGDVTLKAAAATNSPCIIFQRGTLTDNYNDWMIQDRGGYLYFDERGQGSSAWTNRVMFNTTGGVVATTFSGQLSGSISSGTTATTQASTDNSTKVATTAFVKSVLPTVPSNVSSFTNDAGYLTLATLPIYNGTVV